MHQLTLKFAPWMSALVVGGGVFLAPESAHAADMVNGFSVGLTMSFSMGARPAFGIGPDLRYTLFYRPSYDPSNPDAYYTSDYFGAGVFFQPTYLLGGAWRFAGGIHGSRLMDKFFMPTVELGISYRTSFVNNEPRSYGMPIVSDEPGGYGVHLGLLPIFTFLDMLPIEHGPAFRGVIGLSPGVKSEFIIGHDIRGPGACFYTERCYTYVEGRPLRATSDSAPLCAPVFVGSPRQTRSNLATRLGPARSRRLAAHFSRSASTECASIPAFLALARDLARAGAPASLVARARQSAREEANHTRLCTQLAGEFAEFDVGTIVPPLPPVVDQDELTLLKRLAVESFWDGCVGEGAAAAQARRQRTATNLAPVADALTIVARDEQTHADLSSWIVAFCIDRGGAPIRDAVHESVEQRRGFEEEALEDHAADCPDEPLTDVGLPDAEMTRSAREEALEKSLRLVA